MFGDEHTPARALPVAVVYAYFMEAHMFVQFIFWYYYWVTGWDARQEIEKLNYSQEEPSQANPSAALQFLSNSCLASQPVTQLTYL